MADKDEILEYTNSNISDIITPVNPDVLLDLLTVSNYDAIKTKYLVDGFRYGFSIGYRGPTNRQDVSKNIPLTIGTKATLWNKVMKEVQLGRYAGPFDRPPFENFIQSPIGLVPKDKGKKTRLIFHLSFDFGLDDNKRSVNYHIPEESCKVKYRDLDYAIMMSLKLINSSRCK